MSSGNQNAKDKLSCQLMGISADVVKEVFNKTSSTLPTIYLLSIGKVKDLRVTLGIGSEYDDNAIVYKGGESIDLTRRINEHNATYGKMAGANLCLKWFNYIDPQYTSKAETELFQVLGKMGFKFDHKKYDELLIFGKKDAKIVIDQYANISKKYTGHIKELVDKIKDAENTIKEKEYEMNLLKKDHELELMKKKNEILHLEMQLCKMSNSNKHSAL